MSTAAPVATQPATDANGERKTVVSAPARPAMGWGQRIFTAADLAALPDELPSGPVKWELDNGRLIAMPPPGYVHGTSQSKVAGAFLYEGEKKGHGKSCTEVGIVLWRAPFDRVVGADAAFISKARLPVHLTKEGYLETIPDLVAEIKSKNDTGPAIEQKVQDYLAAGVRVVWVLDTEKREVAVHRADAPPRVLTANDDLTVEDVIPGLRVRVAELFEE